MGKLRVPSSTGKTRLDQTPSLLWHVHYSEKFHFVYVDTPKVACSTIKHTLNNAERGEAQPPDLSRTSNNPFGYSDFLLEVHDRRRSLMKWPSSRYEFSEFIDKSRLTFCFVRNPYTRILSAYVDKIAKHRERRSEFLGELGICSPDLERPILFLEFLELVSAQPPGSMNPHWRVQAYHNMIDDIEYDYVGAFETFAYDLDKCLTTISPGLTRFTSTVDEHKTGAERLLSDAYRDPAAVRFVRSIYSEDFLRFRYSDDPGRATEPPRTRERRSI